MASRRRVRSALVQVDSIRWRASRPRIFASVTAPLDKINEGSGIEDVLQERHFGRVGKIPEEQRNACRNATLADTREEPDCMEDRGRRTDGLWHGQRLRDPLRRRDNDLSIKHPITGGQAAEAPLALLGLVLARWVFKAAHTFAADLDAAEVRPIRAFAALVLAGTLLIVLAKPSAVL